MLVDVVAPEPLVTTLNDGAAAVMIMEAYVLFFWAIKVVLTTVGTIVIELHSVLSFCKNCVFMTSVHVCAKAPE